MNHPFLDGNKRVAFAVTDTFLRINGYRIELTSAQIYAALMNFFDTGTFLFAHVEPWLRAAVRPL
jgi:death-on-curing protein